MTYVAGVATSTSVVQVGGVRSRGLTIFVNYGKAADLLYGGLFSTFGVGFFDLQGNGSIPCGFVPCKGRALGVVFPMFSRNGARFRSPQIGFDAVDWGFRSGQLGCLLFLPFWGYGLVLGFIRECYVVCL